MSENLNTGAVAEILCGIGCGWEGLQFSSRTDGVWSLKTAGC